MKALIVIKTWEAQKNDGMDITEPVTVYGKPHILLKQTDPTKRTKF